MKFPSKIFKIFEDHGKYRALKVLRGLPQSTLEDVGISPALLAHGVRAWPWTAKTDTWEPRRTKFQRPVAATMTRVLMESETGAKGVTEENVPAKTAA